MCRVSTVELLIWIGGGLIRTVAAAGSELDSRCFQPPRTSCGASLWERDRDQSDKPSYSSSLQSQRGLFFSTSPGSSTPLYQPPFIYSSSTTMSWSSPEVSCPLGGGECCSADLLAAAIMLTDLSEGTAVHCTTFPVTDSGCFSGGRCSGGRVGFQQSVCHHPA